MERPEFTLRPEYERIIQSVKGGQIKWEFGNKLHIAVVNYARKKEEYIEQMQEYCKENGLSFHEEAYHGEMKEYSVTIHYGGSETYTVEACSEEEAEERATEMFGEDHWDEDVNDVDIEEA